MTISEVSTEDRRNAFYELIRKDNLAPLWQRLHSLVPKITASPLSFRFTGTTTASFVLISSRPVTL